MTYCAAQELQFSLILPRYVETEFFQTPPGGKILRRNVRFVMCHERSEEDVNSWIVVTFHITVAHPGDPNYLPQATTYAHSVKGVLAETAPKDQPAK